MVFQYFGDLSCFMIFFKIFKQLKIIFELLMNFNNGTLSNKKTLEKIYDLQMTL